MLKQTGFRQQSYEEKLAKLKNKLLKAKKLSGKPKKVSKSSYYKELLSHNTWVKKIPLGGHGYTPLQKKLWKLTTDYVRIRDYVTWGTCPSCEKPFTSWYEAQGGHYRSFTQCKGYTKYSHKNVFAQCAFCNSRMNDDKFEGGRIFANNIVKRYGQSRLDEINTYTQGSPVKVEIPIILDMMKEVVYLMKDLPIKTDYFYKLELDK